MGALSRIAGLVSDLFRMLTGIGSGQWATRMGSRVAGALYRVFPGIVVQLLLFLGLTLAVNTFVMPELLGYISGPILGLPAPWQAFLAMTRIDQAITIMLSAMGIAAARRIRLRPVNPSLWT